MRFSVVAQGYDQRQVDSWLDDLAVRLTRLSARAEQAIASAVELERVRQEADQLRAALSRRPATDPGVAQRAISAAEAEAAEIRARARTELSAAQEEARMVRERVYIEALQARRDFEAALLARRQREARVDEILRGVAPVSPDTPTAVAGVSDGGHG